MTTTVSLPPHFIPPHKRGKSTDKPHERPDTSYDLTLCHKATAQNVPVVELESDQRNHAQAVTPVENNPSLTAPHMQIPPHLTSVHTAAVVKPDNYTNRSLAPAPHLEANPESMTEHKDDSLQQDITLDSKQRIVHCVPAPHHKAARDPPTAKAHDIGQRVEEASRPGDVSKAPNSIITAVSVASIATNTHSSAPLVPAANSRTEREVPAKESGQASIPSENSTSLRVLADKQESTIVLTKAPHHKAKMMNPAEVKADSHHQEVEQSSEHIGRQQNTSTSTQPKMALPIRKANDKWTKDSELKNERWQEVKQKKPTAADIKTAWAHAWDVPKTEPTDGVALPKDTSYSILNYDGTWAPAPEDWDSRPAFRDHQSTESIRTWLSVIDYDPIALHFVLKDPRSTNFHQNILESDGSIKRYYFIAPDGSQPTMGNILPITWRPGPMENHGSPAEFWKDYPNMPPYPCDKDDLVGNKPWWETSLSPVACFQLELEQPVHKGVDITDHNKEESQMRISDRGSNNWVERWISGWRPHHAKNKGKGKGRDDNDTSQCQIQAPSQKEMHWITSPHEEVAFEDEDFEVPDLSIKPKINLYLRRAQTNDLTQITQIYNHYVENTARVPECKAVLPSHMNDRLRMIKAVSHTFLVACLASGPSNKGIGRGPGRRGRGVPLANTDRIIGFAYSDDFNDAAGMYRFLAEIEVYTHPEFTNKGVASCLMDKLIAILDPYWICRGGYEIRDDELGSDSSRTVSCLWINLPYIPEESEKEWVSKWLVSIGFEQTGDHKKVGFKIGKCANLAVFTRPTGCEINPKQPPVPMPIPPL